MLIGLSATVFDIDAAIVIDAILSDSETEELSRRVTRVKNLDGTVSIYDGGFSHGDRTFTIQARVDESDVATLKYMTQTYATVLVTTPDGAFEAIIETFNNTGGLVNLKLMISECVSEWTVPTTTTTSSTSSCTSSCSTVSSSCSSTESTGSTASTLSSTSSTESTSTHSTSCSTLSTTNSSVSTQSTSSSTETTTTHTSTCSTQSTTESTASTLSTTSSTDTTQTTTTHTSTCSTQSTTASTASTLSSQSTTTSTASISLSGTTTTSTYPQYGGTYYPAASNQDWYTITSTSDFQNALAYIYMGRDGAANPFNLGVIFDNVTIPHGAVIVSAFVRFTAYRDESDTTCNIRISGFDYASVTPPTNYAQAEGLTLTTANVDWSPTTWVDGNQYDSADISAIVQEIADRGDWNSGQDMGFKFADNVSDTGARSDASSYDYLAGAEKAELHVVWHL